MKYNYVFLVGRPGCGKSAIYRRLEQQILDSNQPTILERVDDFPQVWAMLQSDDALENEGRQRLYSERTAEGGYILTNYGVLNDILDKVSKDLLTIDKPDHLIVLEFARANYVRAIQNFDMRVLARSLVVYMEVSFETCWARNVARHEAALAGGGDDHLVSREQMEELYLHDDQYALVRYLQEQDIPVLVINNEAEGEEHLTRQAEELFAVLFQWPRAHGQIAVYASGILEIGLDPNAQAQGFTAPIGCVDTADIQSRLKALVETGAKVVQDEMDVGGGLLVARLMEADGHFYYQTLEA